MAETYGLPRANLAAIAAYNQLGESTLLVDKLLGLIQLWRAEEGQTSK